MRKGLLLWAPRRGPGPWGLTGHGVRAMVGPPLTSRVRLSQWPLRSDGCSVTPLMRDGHGRDRGPAPGAQRHRQSPALTAVWGLPTLTGPQHPTLQNQKVPEISGVPCAVRCRVPLEAPFLSLPWRALSRDMGAPRPGWQEWARRGLRTTAM